MIGTTIAATFTDDFPFEFASTDVPPPGDNDVVVVVCNEPHFNVMYE